MTLRPVRPGAGSAGPGPVLTGVRTCQAGRCDFGETARPRGGHWSLELYGKNLTDSHASTFTSSAQFIKQEVPLRPLTVGVRLDADF